MSKLTDEQRAAAASALASAIQLKHATSSICEALKIIRATGELPDSCAAFEAALLIFTCELMQVTRAKIDAGSEVAAIMERLRQATPPPPAQQQGGSPS